MTPTLRLLVPTAVLLAFALPASAVTDPVLDPGRLHAVQISMDPADWQALRDNLRSNQYYAADITLDGTTVRQVGIRSRGDGSRDPNKPALKVDFNRYVDGLGTFERLAILANVSVLALYLGCALASWQLRRLGIEDDGSGTAFKVPFGNVTPWLACLAIAWLLTGLTAGEWLAFAVCVAAASLPYAYAASRKRKVKSEK